MRRKVASISPTDCRLHDCNFSTKVAVVQSVLRITITDYDSNFKPDCCARIYRLYLYKLISFSARSRPKICGRAFFSTLRCLWMVAIVCFHCSIFHPNPLPQLQLHDCRPDGLNKFSPAPTADCKPDFADSVSSSMP